MARINDGTQGSVCLWVGTQPNVWWEHGKRPPRSNHYYATVLLTHTKPSCSSLFLFLSNIRSSRAARCYGTTPTQRSARALKLIREKRNVTSKENRKSYFPIKLWPVEFRSYLFLFLFFFFFVVNEYVCIMTIKSFNEISENYWKLFFFFFIFLKCY